MLISATSTLNVSKKKEISDLIRHLRQTEEGKTNRETLPERSQQVVHLVIVALNAAVYPKA